MRSFWFCVLPFASVFLLIAPGRAQQPQPVADPPWLASLTPEQRSLFEDLNYKFGTDDFRGALAEARSLHEQVPQNDTITKFYAEAAINTGEEVLASTLLADLSRTNPDDPQVLSLQAHLYGQQHDVDKRDVILKRIQDLHDSGKPAPSVVIVERHPLPDGGAVRLSDYIVPQSRFHIVLMADFLDASGQRTKRIALESDDIDQLKFKQEHPDQAAAGVRIYSMDSYSEIRNGSGQVVSQQHSTLCPVPECFMTGRPPYELFRKTVLGSASSISSSTVPVKPPQNSTTK